MFWQEHPLCRYAASPPEGEKIHFHLQIFSPHRGEWPKSLPRKAGPRGYIIRKGVPFLRNALLIKVGDDLLSHNCSTIGAVGLNFSVRNGKRWNPDAIVT